MVKWGSNEYKSAHKRVSYYRGTAINNDCECGNIAEQWAHIHNTDINDIRNFKPMCAICHSKYDGQSEKQKGKSNSNVTLSEEMVLEIRKLYSQGLTQEEIAKSFPVSRVQVGRIVNRKSWTHV